MKDCVILVDNSNVFIEGSKYSARKKGVLKTSEEDRDPSDPSWRVDFGALIREVSEGMKVEKAILVGSTPPKSDSIWESARHHGFEVITHERDFSGKEKAVDTEIVAQGTEIICTLPNASVLKLLSGDRDFIPLIKIANNRNWETEMWAFTSAFRAHGEMATTVMRVKPLDIIFEKIGRNEFEWPIK